MVSLNFILALIAVFSMKGIYADEDILGCGGFVKSEVKIEFSKIEIQLFTSEGMLKYQTECAPNNGYFMIPFVEKGNFILKIDPPKGWLFDPMSVVLNVDGVSDDCSKGNDINFLFKGFTVIGQVSSVLASNAGPEGVTLEIISEKTGKVAGMAKSLNGGAFKFDGVLPGSYKVIANHPSFTFNKQQTTVTVSNQNTKCGEELIVSGYNVRGEVSAQSLPVTGVQLMLFTKTRLIKEVTGCNAAKPTGAEKSSCPGYPVFVCTATSTDHYQFSNLPPAEYCIVPYHKGERTQYDIEPQVLELPVINSHVEKGTGFVVTGYSVQGRILSSENGPPVEGAKIFIGGKFRDTTNSRGSYTIQHKQTGLSDQDTKLEIVVKKEDMDFQPVKIAIGPDIAFIKNIVASSFSVCGRVNVLEEPSASFDVTQLAVKIISADESQTVHLDKNGLFCFMKKPGDYTLKTIIPKALEDQGLVLIPTEVKTKVTNAPEKSISFAQYRASFQVRVSCVSSCQDVTVEMIPLLPGRKKKQVKIADKINDTKVEFSNVLPGGYTLRVAHDDWCWDAEEGKVTIPREEKSQTMELFHFKQSGFVLVCSISHDIEMVINYGEEKGDTFSLKKGRNRLCLSRLGEYKLEPRSCHRFDVQSPIVYNTAHPKPITLHAVAHQAVVVMETSKDYPNSKVKDEEIPVQLRSSRGKVTKEYLTLYEEDSDKSDSLVYRFTYWASDGEKLEITPSSNVLLFDPPSFSATMHAGGCSTELVRFKGLVGSFIYGKISPPLSNVLITITTGEAEENVAQMTTGKDGEYRVGPLHPDRKYKISAVLEDYVMTPVDDKEGWFMAKKLSKLVFKINLENTETPLPGVFISISGGDYRSNNLTGSDGTLTLTKLEPGNYYFKAIMKEYQFDPPSQVIDIVEGAKTEINIIGKRVAYSAYGTVTSLNGEPEVGTFVRAIARPGNDQCTGLGEEGASGNDGSFRIRGLRPGCVYDLYLKDKAERFSRVIPDQVTITAKERDAEDLKFIAFRPMSGFDLSGNVITSVEYLPHIKLALYRAGEASSSTPVHVVSLSKASPFFQLPSLTRDGAEYVIKLECSLPNNVYEYTAPAAGFFTSGPYKHVTFRFEPQMKPMELDTSQAPIIALPLTLLVMFLAYNYAQVYVYLQQTYQRLSAKPAASDITSKSNRRSKK